MSNCCLRLANILAWDCLTFISPNWLKPQVKTRRNHSASEVSEEVVEIQFSFQKSDRDHLTCKKNDNVIGKLTLYY